MSDINLIIPSESKEQEFENPPQIKETPKKNLKTIVANILNCFSLKKKQKKRRKDKLKVKKKEYLSQMDGLIFFNKNEPLKIKSIEYPKIANLNRDEEIGNEEGELLAGEGMTKGKSEKGEAFIFRDFENLIFTEFELDALVAAKRRISTFKRTKKWSKEEDENLRNALKICKNNWKLVAQKLEAKRCKNDSLKTSEDCKRRWIALSKGFKYNWNQESEDKLLELVSIKGK